MPGKQRYLRSIDARSTQPFAAGADEFSAAAIEPPAQASIGAPTNLSLSTAIERSATTASARISATWYPPAGVAPSSYVIQWSTSNTFPDGSTNGQGSDDEATTIGGLTPATTYYVRVAAIAGNVVGAWSDTGSILTASDTTPPNAPTSQAATFIGAGDLVVTWVNSTSANYRDTEIVIYSDAAKTTTYATIYDATQSYVWTAAQNLAATSNAGDPTLYVELRSRSWGGIFSSAVNTGTITKTAPSAPTVAQSWSSDTGTAGADLTFNITAVTGALYYSFVLNGLTARRVDATTYTYTLDRNISDNTSADPTITYSITAVDGLNQASSATAGTATNAAPTAPTVTLIGGQNQLVASVTSAPVADFAAWEYVWKKDGSAVLTLESQSAEQQYAAQTGDEGTHSWTCTVRQKDVFAQYSTATVSSTVVLDALTIAYLRAGLVFSDSVGASVSTLAVLKDAVTASGGISYAA